MPKTAAKSKKAPPPGRTGNDSSAEQRSLRYSDDRVVIKHQVDSLVERVKAMTSEEFRASLLAAGIITKSGKLAKPYRS